MQAKLMLFPRQISVSDFYINLLANQAAMNPPAVRIVDSKVELSWTETLSDVQIQYKR